MSMVFHNVVSICFVDLRRSLRRFAYRLLNCGCHSADILWGADCDPPDSPQAAAFLGSNTPVASFQFTFFAARGNGQGRHCQREGQLFIFWGPRAELFGIEPFTTAAGLRKEILVASVK
jgi:hypothetical protein